MGRDEVRRPYIKVYGALAGLTLLELLVAFLPILKVFQNLSLVALAIAKALLVAMFYMHLKYEPRGLIVIPAVTLLLGIALGLAFFA